MLSFFKGRRADAKPTFKSRVDAFWQWYAGQAPRFFKTIEESRCRDLTEEVDAKLDEYLPDFAWVFGPGASGEGHSFTLSGEANPHKQLLARFWHEQAPNLPGWTFYSTRQASDSIEGRKLIIGGLDFNPLEFWLAPHVDRESEQVDLTVWHLAFPKMEEQMRWTSILLFLDEVLGEVGTQNWIGQISFGDHRLSDSIPLRELPSYIARLASETGWKKSEPGELFTSYEGNVPERGSLRQDIIVGSTRQFSLITECQDGMLDPDPLEGFGADYLFLAFDVRVLPEGRQVECRGAMEDALEAALHQAKQGRVLGGALGIQYAYIDLLLWDGAQSIETVQRVAREQGLPAGATLEYFAKAKRRERVRL